MKQNNKIEQYPQWDFNSPLHPYILYSSPGLNSTTRSTPLDTGRDTGDICPPRLLHVRTTLSANKYLLNKLAHKGTRHSHAVGPRYATTVTHVQDGNEWAGEASFKFWIIIIIIILINKASPPAWITSFGLR